MLTYNSVQKEINKLFPLPEKMPLSNRKDEKVENNNSLIA